MIMMVLAAMTAKAQTGKWINDKDHTRIGFEIKHAGLSWVSGYFKDFTIDVDAAGKNCLGTKVNASIQTKSIDTGIEARNSHLRTADFFEVDNYPTMTFTSTRFVALSKTRGRMYGNLTIKGVTKPVILTGDLIAKQVSPMTKVMTAGFRLKGVVRRSDFGLGPKFLPAIVGDKVTIIVDAEFSPEKK